MPNTHTTLVSLFSDVADAIRAKDGTSAAIVADTFPDRILAIAPAPEEADMYAGSSEPTGAVDGDLWVDTSDDIEPITITSNGTTTAPAGKAYSPVTVNVPAVTKNVQVYTTPVSTTSTTMANTNMKITVSKAGTYNIYLTAGCNRNSGTYNYRLMNGSTTLVSSTTISTTTGVCKVLTNRYLNKNAVLTVGLQSASASYRAYATSLIIIEQ